LNAKHSTTSKYKSNFRFYFTSCRITPLKAISKTEVKKLVASSMFTGLLDNSEAVSFDQTKENTPDATDVIERDKDYDNEGNILTTRVIDTAREKIRQEVLLV
jgi:hypothetical protein